MTSNHFLKFSVDTNFSVLFIKPFTKNYGTISKLSGIFSPKVNSVFLFSVVMISDVFSKDQEIFIFQKKCKKGIKNNFSWAEDDNA